MCSIASREPCVLARRRRRSRSPCAAASRARARRPHRLGEGVAAVGARAGVHAHEAAEDRARRRAASRGARGSTARAAPSVEAGGAVAATASAAKPDADDASPDAVGKSLRCRHARARGDAAARAHEVEKRRDARQPAGRSPAGRRARARRRQRRDRSSTVVSVTSAVERQRQAAGGRQVERGVALAPVLDERDVGARARGDAVMVTRVAGRSRPSRAREARSLPSALHAARISSVLAAAARAR